jgi:hypothetical protein
LQPTACTHAGSDRTQQAAAVPVTAPTFAALQREDRHNFHYNGETFAAAAVELKIFSAQ